VNLKKHWKTMSVVATDSLHDQGFVLIGNYTLRLLRVVFLISLWRTLLPEEGDISGMTRDAVLTYTLIAEIFSGFMSVRTGLDEALWRGDIANRLLRPVGIYGQFIAEMLGDRIPNLILFSLPLFCIAPFFDINPLPANPTSGGLFIVSLLLGVLIGVAFDFIFASLLVFLEQSVYALMQIRDAVSVLLSGAIIPLAFLPWGLGDALTWLPFASVASAPLRIYTNTGDPIFLLSLQVAWTIVLWPIAHALWNFNRERLVSHGG
jgi:ABC-2 type transport system permease protein